MVKRSKMKKLTLVFFSFFFSSILAASSPTEEDLSESSDYLNENLNGLRYFRISNSGASYEHATATDYHRLILERSRLYSMLAEISKEIEALDSDKFLERLVENKERIGFCARFHIISMILNRYYRSTIAADLNLNPILEMIGSLTFLEILEIPNEIVLDQFVSFSETIEKVIDDLIAKGCEETLLANKLHHFMEAENIRISVLRS